MLWSWLPCFYSINLPNTLKHKFYKDYSIYYSCNQPICFKYRSNYITFYNLSPELKERLKFYSSLALGLVNRYTNDVRIFKRKQQKQPTAHHWVSHLEGCIPQNKTWVNTLEALTYFLIIMKSKSPLEKPVHMPKFSSQQQSWRVERHKKVSIVKEISFPPLPPF